MHLLRFYLSCKLADWWRHYSFPIISEVLCNFGEAFPFQGSQEVIPAILLLIYRVLKIENEEGKRFCKLSLEVHRNHLVREDSLDQLSHDCHLQHDHSVLRTACRYLSLFHWRN